MENSMKNSIDIDQGHKGIETKKIASSMVISCLKHKPNNRWRPKGHRKKIHFQFYGDQFPEPQT